MFNETWSKFYHKCWKLKCGMEIRKCPRQKFYWWSGHSRSKLLNESTCSCLLASMETNSKVNQPISDECLMLAQYMTLRAWVFGNHNKLLTHVYAPCTCEAIKADEAECSRLWRLQKDREVAQLKQEDQKRAKMDLQHSKQQKVLKHKKEKAVAVNKRLQNALQLQKSVAERRSKGKEQNAATRVKQWVKQESEIQIRSKAVHHLENLLEERETISRELNDLKNSLETFEPPKKEQSLDNDDYDYDKRRYSCDKQEREKAKLVSQIKLLEQDLDLRNLQISSLKQGILDVKQITVSTDLHAYQIRSATSSPNSSLSQNVVMTSSGSLSPHHVAEEASRKRELRLLKNREAAKECRRKKNEYIKCLENRVAVLENQNKALIDELKSLKELYCQKND